MVGKSVSAFNGFGSLLDKAKNLLEIRDAAKINPIVVELTSEIMSAQAAQSALVTRVSDLEKELMRFEDWEGEKKRYELKAIDTGAFAYMPKAGVENSETPHWLCANCFERKHKSYLQFKGQDVKRNGTRGSTSTYGCDACKGKVTVYYTRNPQKAWSPSPPE